MGFSVVLAGFLYFFLCGHGTNLFLKVGSFFFFGIGGFKVVGDDILSWSMKRSLLEEVKNGKNSSLVLAAERTHRKDPLRDGAYYTGGWNISDKHYLAVSFNLFLLIGNFPL